MAHLHALPIGLEIEGYRIERVLGSGGFGITYQAAEPMIGRLVAIKEYLPSSVAARALDSLTVHPLVAADAEIFRWGLKRFRNEARTLVSFRHPNIVQVYRYFEANGTAYLVMAYEDGASLAEILKTARTLPESEIREFLDPLLDGVAEVHKAGFLHRDIKPANIVIRASGEPVLIDFGAARQALGAKSQSLHAIVSPGYAPFEQYSNTAPQGPYSDIYALGATLYCCVSGVRPVEATDRLAGAPMRAAAELGAGQYSARLLQAIDCALALMPEERPQTVAAWREELAPLPEAASESTLAAPVSAAPTSVTAPPPAKSRPSRRAVQLGLLAAGLSVLGVGGFAGVRAYVEDQREREAEAARKAAEEAKKRAEEAARAEQERKEGAARQRAEAAAERGREAQARALATERAALSAKQQALNAADCARKAAQRARNRETGHYAGALTNGNQYEGQINTSTRLIEGCGIVTEASGGRYEGQVQAGNWHGYGLRIGKDGLRYEGTYKNGVLDGYGVARFTDGTEARMVAVQGVFTGPGVWINPDGARYEGDLKSERWSGYGVLRFRDTATYAGEFADGQMQGLGVYTDAGGRKKHGRWEKGVYKGLG